MTSTLNEVLKQALEALEYMGMTAERYVDNRIPEAAITAIKEAIREHAMYEVQRLGQEIEQEAVALETVYETIIQWDEGGGKRSRRDLARRIIDLYTHPPQHTEQEPVECDGDFPEGFDKSLDIPAQALRQANAALCEVTNNRMWDVPALAERMLMFCRNTHPPQRTWVGLTDEEIDKTHETQVWDARRSYARAIEAKLKEKNP